MKIKLKWNTKHRDRMRQMAETTPNPRLMKQSAYLTGGTGLDLACGLGGNSLFLTEKKTDMMHLLSNG